MVAEPVLMLPVGRTLLIAGGVVSCQPVCVVHGSASEPPVKL